MISRKGFTLVELLVVIGIISVLAAMLFPALEQSLASARSTYCMNNLKQMGFSTHLYTNDNNGWVIPSSLWNGINFSGRDNCIQFFYLLAYLDYLPHERYTTASPHGIKFTQSNIPSGTSVYPITTGAYIKPYNPMHFCPLSRPLTDSALSLSGQNSEFLYGVHDGFFNLNSSPVITRTLGATVSYRISEWGNIVSTTLPPSRFIMWGDSCGWHGTSLDCPYVQQSLAYSSTNYYWSLSPFEQQNLYGLFHLRHNKAGNAWFADGHVANIPYTPTINKDYRVIASFGPDS